MLSTYLSILWYKIYFLLPLLLHRLLRGVAISPLHPYYATERLQTNGCQTSALSGSQLQNVNKHPHYFLGTCRAMKDSRKRRKSRRDSTSSSSSSSRDSSASSTSGTSDSDSSSTSSSSRSSSVERKRRKKELKKKLAKQQKKEAKAKKKALRKEKKARRKQEKLESKLAKRKLKEERKSRRKQEKHSKDGDIPNSSSSRTVPPSAGKDQGSGPSVLASDPSLDCGIPLDLMNRKAMAPETREEYEARQSILRRVVDPETGRTRLIKGDGEIIEECVSRDRHKEINRQATAGDGAEFQRKTLGRNVR